MPSFFAAVLLHLPVAGSRVLLPLVCLLTLLSLCLALNPASLSSLLLLRVAVACGVGVGGWVVARGCGRRGRGAVTVRVYLDGDGWRMWLNSWFQEASGDDDSSGRNVDEDGFRL